MFKFDGHLEHVILGLLGLLLIWFFSGGASNPLARQGLYLKPLSPIDSGTGYGTKEISDTEKKKTEVVLPRNIIDPVTLENILNGLLNNTNADSKDTEPEAITEANQATITPQSVSIEDITRTKTGKADDEIITLLARKTNATPVVITGATLYSSASSNGAVIPKGSSLFLQNSKLNEEAITLDAGEKAFIVSGRSPVGTSFKVNKCSGYLDQFQKYNPEITHTCPLPQEELSTAGLASDEACKAFVSDMPQCRIYKDPLPTNLSLSCKQFITEKLTYNGCVTEHFKDKDFYKPEWRIFLGKTNELWQIKREIVKLLDANGKTVDSITY